MADRVGVGADFHLSGASQLDRLYGFGFRMIFEERQVADLVGGRDTHADEIGLIELRDLWSAIGAANTAQGKYAFFTVMTDICTYAYRHECLVTMVPDLFQVAKEINDSKLTTSRPTFLMAFERFLAADIDHVRTSIGMDFAPKFADPIGDPSLAIRFYILDAKVHQYIGSTRQLGKNRGPHS